LVFCLNSWILIFAIDEFKRFLLRVITGRVRTKKPKPEQQPKTTFLAHLRPWCMHGFFGSGFFGLPDTSVGFYRIRLDLWCFEESDMNRIKRRWRRSCSIQITKK
jgi:hypothetical protein